MSNPADDVVEPLPGLKLRSSFAEQVNRGERTLKRWEHAGKLRTVRLGNRVYVDVDGTLALLRASGAKAPTKRGRPRKRG
jgi:hypothetical protein